MTSSFGIGGFGSAFNVYQLPGLSQLTGVVATNALAQENPRNVEVHPDPHMLSPFTERLLVGVPATLGVGYGVWRTLETLKATAADMATSGPGDGRYYSAGEVTCPIIRDKFLEMALHLVPDSALAQGVMSLALGAGLVFGGYALVQATHRQLLIEGLCRNLMDDRRNVRDESYNLLIKLDVMDTVVARLENLKVKATSTDPAQIPKVLRALEEIRIAKLIAALTHGRSVDQMLEELANLPVEDQGPVRQTVFDAHLRFATDHPWAVSEIVSFFAAFRTDDHHYGFDYMMDVLRTRHAELTPNLRREMGTACIDIMMNMKSDMPFAEARNALWPILNWREVAIEYRHTGYVFAHWPEMLSSVRLQTVMWPCQTQINETGLDFTAVSLTPDVLTNLKATFGLQDGAISKFFDDILKGLMQVMPAAGYLAFLEDIHNAGVSKYLIAKYYIEYLNRGLLGSPLPLSAVIHVEEVCYAQNIEFIIEAPTLTPRTDPAVISKNGCLTVRIPQYAESHLLALCDRQGLAFHIRVAAARALLENGSGIRYLPAWAKGGGLSANERGQAKTSLEAVGRGNSQGKELAQMALEYLKTDLARISHT